VDGEINSNLLHSVDAEVVECQVHPMSSDAPLAEVRDATLVVKVSMFSATPTDYKLENWEFHMDSSTPLGSEKISQYALIGWKVSAKARGLVLMSTFEGVHTRIEMFEVPSGRCGTANQPTEKVSVRPAVFPDKLERIIIV
jgi:hypothetical protein